MAGLKAWGDNGVRYPWRSTEVKRSSGSWPVFAARNPTWLYVLHLNHNGNSLQYSCLENLMDRGAWWATIHGVTKSRTRLSDFCACVCVCVCVCVCMHACSGMSDSFQPPWTVTYQAPLSMGFPRQEYWSRLPFPPPEDLPDPKIKPKDCRRIPYLK